VGFLGSTSAEKNNEAERGTDEKSEPPADVGIKAGRVQNEYIDAAAPSAPPIQNEPLMARSVPEQPGLAAAN
jgi:hypothetical protein